MKTSSFFIFCLFLSLVLNAQNPNVKIKVAKETPIFKAEKPDIKIYEKATLSDTMIFFIFDDIRFSSSSISGADILTKEQFKNMVDGFYEMTDPKYMPNESTMDLKSGVILAKVKIAKKEYYWYKSVNRNGGVAQFTEAQVIELKNSCYKYLNISE